MASRIGAWRQSWDWGALILRAVLGVSIFLHGTQKLFGAFGGRGPEAWIANVERMGFPAGPLFGWAAIFAEFGGGLLLLFGVATEVGALFIAANMLVAITKVHWPRGFFNGGGGFEFPLLILNVCVALIVSGPGRFALWDPFRRRA